MQHAAPSAQSIMPCMTLDCLSPHPSWGGPERDGFTSLRIKKAEKLRHCCSKAASGEKGTRRKPFCNIVLACQNV
eukprot:8130745-Heterocapsa_arctica.AAC.1